MLPPREAGTCSTDHLEAVHTLRFPGPGERAETAFVLSSFQSSSQASASDKQNHTMGIPHKPHTYKAPKTIKLQPQTSLFPTELSVMVETQTVR